MEVTQTVSFLDYTLEEAGRLWHNDHKVKSIRKAEKFSQFADYSTRSIADYKPRHIHKFLDYLTEECGLTNNTANHYCAMIIKVFKQAYKNQDIDRVPDFTWKRVDDTHRMTYFDSEQVDEIVKYFRTGKKNTWMADFVLIAANTGMRLGEIRSITPNNVYQDNKGDWNAQLLDTKNGDDRIVYLNDKARYALLNLNNQPDNYYKSWRFYSTWDGMRDKLLGGDENYVFHSLRHTFATRMANEVRLNSFVIAKMMRHRTLKTTEKYVKLMPEQAKKACDAI